MRRWKLNLDEGVDGIFFNGSQYTLLNVEPRQYGERAIYGPIPQSETVKFSALEQNRGWWFFQYKN